MTDDLAGIERRLATRAGGDRFSDAEIDGVPEPARRYLRASIARGTPLAVAARLRMHGRVKLGVWVPFRATQILSPLRGFVWRGRVLGVLAGADHYADGTGGSTWKAAGAVRVINQSGPDTSRSSAGRSGIEAMWLPTVLLPRFGVRWIATADDDITATYAVDDTPIEAHYRIDERGLPTSLHVSRWGDPYGSGTFGWHIFGGEFTGWRTFDGLAIPHRGKFGWSFGTPDWSRGEFFRYEISELAPL